MLRYNKLEHRFVQYIPDELEPGVLYISMEYATAAHSCCCGCGLQVITPFTPTDWKLTFDGETISLWPSIGNWSFPCRSHYIIRHSRVLNAEIWEDAQVDEKGRHNKEKGRAQDGKNSRQEDRPSIQPVTPKPKKRGFWGRITRNIRKKRP